MATPRHMLDPLLAPDGRVSALVSEDGYHVSAIGDVLGLTPARLAKLTGRTTESAAQLFDGAPKRPRDPRTREVLGELVEIIGLLDALGGLDNARSWFATPLPSHGGQSPFEVVAARNGRALIANLLALATGNVGG